MDLICKVPRANLLSRLLIWPGHFGAATFGLFGLYPSSLNCQSLLDSFLPLGELHWFLYLMLCYFYDPSMLVYLWNSNFVEKLKLCWKKSLAAEMPPRASYFVYYIVWRVNLSKLSLSS